MQHGPSRGFPSFGLLFQPGSGTTAPLYLMLLNIGSDTVQAIAAIRDAGRRSGAGLDAELAGLFAELNWRPQLVAGVALLVLGANDARIDWLWGAMRRPCWVSPQLAAVANLIDPGFERRARERIEAGCPLDVAGAQSGPVRSVKLLSSLARLVESRIPAERTEYVRTSSIQEMIARDAEHGGDNAIQWLAGIEQLRKAGHL